MFEVPEKFDAPDIVLMRGWRFDGVFHVVGSKTDMLSKDNSSQLSTLSLFLEHQPLLCFLLALKNMGKHPPTMKIKSIRKDFAKRDMTTLTSRHNT